MKFAIIQIKCRPSEGNFTESADRELAKTKLKKGDILFITGIVWEDSTTISLRQVTLITETHCWVQKQAESYGISVVMENFVQENSDKLISKCSLRFEKDQRHTIIASPGKVIAMKDSVTAVFSQDISKEWAQTTLRSRVSFIVVHVNSKSQNPTPKGEKLQQLLKQLGLLTTTSHPIIVLISNGMGMSALLRIQKAHMYIYKIWKYDEKWLEIFDTTTTLNQTIIHQRDKFEITEDGYFWEQDRVFLGLQWLLDPRIWKSWLTFKYKYLPRDVRSSTLVMISMEEQKALQTDQEDRKHWLTKLWRHFVPLSGELIFMVFTNREIPESLVSEKIFYKFRGKTERTLIGEPALEEESALKGEPSLRGVYTTKEISPRLIPVDSRLKVDTLGSVGESDIYVVSNE